MTRDADLSSRSGTTARARLLSLTTRSDVTKLALSLGPGTFFGSVFVTGLPLWQAGGIGMAGAVVGGLGMWLLRRGVPADIDAVDAEHADQTTAVGQDATGGDEGRDVFGIVMVAVGVPVIVVVGLVVQFVVPLAVIGGFLVADSDVSLVSALMAAVCFLGLMACYEFGVEAPLLRRWGLPARPEGRPVRDSCPPPGSSGADGRCEPGR